MIISFYHNRLNNYFNFFICDITKNNYYNISLIIISIANFIINGFKKGLDVTCGRDGKVLIWAKLVEPIYR